jgi:hypothetical protein
VKILLIHGYLRAVLVIDGYENKKKREFALQKFLFTFGTWCWSFHTWYVKESNLIEKHLRKAKQLQQQNDFTKQNWLSLQNPTLFF